MARVLLNCPNPVGYTMSGPAIRYWELAKSLSKNHEVVLIVPNTCDLPLQTFKVIKNTSNYHRLFQGMDFVITMLATPSLALAAKMRGVKLILDAYDPHPFELLEINKTNDLPARKKDLDQLMDTYNFSFNIADAVICANENQRDLWTGMMLSLKKINPALYALDPSLNNQIALVPFGLPSEPPVKLGKGPRELFNLKDSDKIILWGGGIWEWFDPLTLIRAMHQISQKRSDIHLIFMGVKMPSESSSQISMSEKAYQLSKELNLLNKHVFFNQNWIPYEQRSAFLLEADIGISTHYDHLETRYSFRTRLLDYIWAGLPIINTEGDSFSRLIEENEIGLTVPYKDVAALSNAILHLIDNPQVTEKMKANLNTVKEGFYWDKTCEPLEKIIATPWKKKSKAVAIKTVLESIYSMGGPLFILKAVTSRLVKRFAAVKDS